MTTKVPWATHLHLNLFRLAYDFLTQPDRLKDIISSTTKSKTFLSSISLLTLKWIWAEQCWPSYFISRLKGFLALALWPVNSEAGRTNFTLHQQYRTYLVLYEHCANFCTAIFVKDWLVPGLTRQDHSTLTFSCLHAFDQLNFLIGKTFITEKYWLVDFDQLNQTEFLGRKNFHCWKILI